MPLYRVEVRIHSKVTVSIEADDEEEAEDIADMLDAWDMLNEQDGASLTDQWFELLHVERDKQAEE